jgi:ABC-type sugar transport system ATPase subunit
MNFLRGRVEAAGDALAVRTGDRTLPVPTRYRGALAARADADVLVGIRPEALGIRPDGPLAGEVVVVEPLGSHHLLTVNVGAVRLKVTVDGDEAPHPGEAIRLTPDPGRLRYMDPGTGLAIPPA